MNINNINNNYNNIKNKNIFNLIFIINFLLIFVLNLCVLLFDEILFLFTIFSSIFLLLLVLFVTKKNKNIIKQENNINNNKLQIFSEKLFEYAKNSENIYIMGHKYSDFDSLGASIGLYGALKSTIKNKNIYIILNREQSLSEPLFKYINNFENLNNIVISPEISNFNNINNNSLLIILDTHSEKLLESHEIYELFKKIIVIDHHNINKNINKINNSSVFFNNSGASSVCEIITEIIYNNNINITKYQAESLLSGIMLDTKNFTLNTSYKTFELGSCLKKLGADNFNIKKIFNNPINIQKIKSNIIENSEIFGDFIISVCPEKIYNTSNFNELKLACVQSADDLLNIKNIKASFVIFQENSGVSISARSFGEINVQNIMQEFGGGGHQTMAAAHIPNSSTNIIKQNLIEIISNQNF